MSQVALDLKNSVTSLSSNVSAYTNSPTSPNTLQIALSLQGLVGSLLAFCESVPGLNVVASGLGVTASLAAVRLDATALAATRNDANSTLSDITTAYEALLADSTAAASGLAAAVAIVLPETAEALAPAIAVFSGISANFY